MAARSSNSGLGADTGKMDRAIRLAAAVIGATCVSGMVVPATGVAVTASVGTPTLARHVVAPTTVPLPPAPPTEPVSAPPAPEPAPVEPPSGIRVTLVDEARGRTLVAALHVPTAGSGGPYPLVAFARGFAVSAGTYAALEQQIADAGFVVAAPEFPLTSSASGRDLDRDDIVNQAADVSFVITQILDPATTPTAVQGLVNSTAPVGVVGHSDGGSPRRRSPTTTRSPTPGSVPPSCCRARRSRLRGAGSLGSRPRCSRSTVTPTQ
jgi:hypothetical protein